MANSSSTHVARLRSEIAGEVFVADDAGYAAAVSGANLAVTCAADIVVVARSEADIQVAVRFAAANDVPLQVQATGHGAAAEIPKGMLIVTSKLDSVTIDPTTRIATIGAGARWGAVIAAGADHGLLPISGSSATVGAVGYTLGGGLGPLCRSHGFSSDYARGFRVVLADGSVVNANPDHNPDLFWALRGGRPTLGVVTSMDFELVTLAELYGGSLLIDTADIDAVLRGWLEWTATAPTQVTTSLNIVRFPPFEFIPELMRGKTLAALRFADPGADGETNAAPLRALATPLIDTVAVMPSSDIAVINNDPTEPSAAWANGMQLTHADGRFADAFLSFVGANAQVPIVAAELRHLGNRTAVDVSGGSAVGGRDATFALSIIGMITPVVDAATISAFFGSLRDALAPWLSPVTTINFAGHPTSGELAACWSPEIFEQLQAVTKEYDPDRVFAPAH